MPIGLASLYDNEIIGFCNIRLNALNHYECNYPFICGLYICEEFRNKGYGTLLIKCAIDKIKKMGYTKVYLWTEEIPEYYERLGFHYIKDILKNI